MKKKNKAGQFYLFAAIIIISLIIGFAVISNYSKTRTSTKIYDLGEELKIESAEVLDYGTYNEYSKEEMKDLLGNFTEVYSEYAGKDVAIFFISGNKEGVEIYDYPEEGGEGIGEEQVEIIGEKIIVTVDEIKYEFSLKSGENFYFIISQKIDGEKHIITNKIIDNPN